jgi:hypothetical protein
VHKRLEYKQGQGDLQTRETTGRQKLQNKTTKAKAGRNNRTTTSKKADKSTTASKNLYPITLITIGQQPIE